MTRKERKAVASVIGKTGPMKRLDWPVSCAICRNSGRTRSMESAQTNTITTLRAFPGVGSPTPPFERAPRRMRPTPTARRMSASRTAAKPEYGFQSIRPNDELAAITSRALSVPRS